MGKRVLSGVQGADRRHDAADFGRRPYHQGIVHELLAA
jgi:hypothetical protein